jgi:DNA-binding transcriptional ArsR family regulator
MGPFEVVLEGLDSAEVTVSESPIATVLTSLVEVFGPLRGRLPAALQRQIRTLSRQVDLAALEPVFNRASVPLPSALMPTTVGRASFAEEVERLRGDHQEVADQFAVSLPDETPVAFRPWLSNPARALDRYLRALCSYHDVVTTAVHPRLAERLRREADLLRRAAETDRHRYLLTRLPGYARTETASVRVKVRDLRNSDLRRRIDRILLVPMLSDPNTQLSNIYGRQYDSRVMLGLASPNLAQFADPGRPAGSTDPLAALIGPSQACILRQLVRAATTSDLAEALNLAPSTVSHHLQTLLNADTVEAHRHGRNVYYRLTNRGYNLLQMYGTPV